MLKCNLLDVGLHLDRERLGTFSSHSDKLLLREAFRHCDPGTRTFTDRIQQRVPRGSRCCPDGAGIAGLSEWNGDKATAAFVFPEPVACVQRSKKSIGVEVAQWSKH